MKKGFMKTLSEVVARQNSMGDSLVTPEGKIIYKLDMGWENKVIADDKSISCVETALELEDALNDVEVETLLIPKSNSITTEILFRIVDRCSQEKTVFVEQ